MRRKADLTTCIRFFRDCYNYLHYQWHTKWFEEYSFILRTGKTCKNKLNFNLHNQSWVCILSPQSILKAKNNTVKNLREFSHLDTHSLKYIRSVRYWGALYWKLKVNNMCLNVSLYQHVSISKQIISRESGIFSHWLMTCHAWKPCFLLGINYEKDVKVITH